MTSETRASQKIGTTELSTSTWPIEVKIIRTASVDDKATRLVSSAVKRIDVGGAGFENRKAWEEFRDLVTAADKAICGNRWVGEAVDVPAPDEAMA